MISLHVCRAPLDWQDWREIRARKERRYVISYTYTQGKYTWLYLYVCVCVWFRVMEVWLVWLGRRVSSERKVIEDCRETRDRREPKERRWKHKLIYTDIYTNSYRRWFNCVSADRVQLDLQDSMDPRDHRDCLWVWRHCNLQFWMRLGLFWCHSFCLYHCVSGIHGTKRI